MCPLHWLMAVNFLPLSCVASGEYLPSLGCQRDTFFWQLSDTFSVKHFSVWVCVFCFVFFRQTCITQRLELLKIIQQWVFLSHKMWDKDEELIWRNKTISCMLKIIFLSRLFIFIFRPTWGGCCGVALKRNMKTFLPVTLPLLPLHLHHAAQWSPYQLCWENSGLRWDQWEFMVLVMPDPKDSEYTRLGWFGVCIIWCNANRKKKNLFENVMKV